MGEEISFSNRQTSFISLNNRIWVPIWQLIRLIRARAHLRGTDADGAKLETMLEWTRSRGGRRGGARGTSGVLNCYHTSWELNQGLRPVAQRIQETSGSRRQKEVSWYWVPVILNCELPKVGLEHSRFTQAETQRWTCQRWRDATPKHTHLHTRVDQCSKEETCVCLTTDPPG